MCGIVGIVGFRARVPSEVLERANQSLVHRGPDDGGTVILRDPVQPEIEIGLGNRRLAILDLSPLGHQPMRDAATGNCIVYNGEIYNFREVRAMLERAGAKFVSASDTEVILKAYAQWGERCLHEFRGMFAFAIWDAQHSCLFMARDPMGIKPLYFYSGEKYFLFSSEVRTLLGTGLVPRRLDRQGLSTYLDFGSVYEPRTLVEGVRALPPGSYLLWKDGNSQQRRYWDLIDPEEQFSQPSRAQAEAQIAEALDEAVNMQLVSDVPVGVFLSGGIDSSSLVGLMSRRSVRPSTFSIVFREADYSEAEFSRAIAHQFRTDHHEITVSQQDFFAAVEPALAAMDLPTIDGINTYFVSERTRAAGVKVALSGLGGDELFAGYTSFRDVPRMEQFSRWWGGIPASVRRPLAGAFALASPENDRNRKLVALAHSNGHAIHPYFLSRMLFTPAQRASLIGAKDAASGERCENDLRENLCRASALDPVNRVSYLEARCYMLNTLLRDSDFMSMAHGLEVRVPLIDHQLARRVLSLPGGWKLDAKTPKPLLVQALRGELPDKIVHRPKRGFTLPFEPWLRGEMRSTVENSIRQIGSGPLSGVVSQFAAQRIWDDFIAGRTSWSRPWSLHVLQSWCNRHLAS
ncbi:MAG TPA: asparagine synthase (glutamine-hydrolyzing) [Candidatus Binatia bacterium]|nr:asparagine synthase (glutamine-hydrolyzing) [Candidatus Binatia bacterium]